MNKNKQLELELIYNCISRWVKRFSINFRDCWDGRLTKKYIEHQFFILQKLFEELEIRIKTEKQIHFHNSGNEFVFTRDKNKIYVEL